MALYPGAIWRGPIPSSNFSTNPGRKIGIVNHVIVGSAGSAINEFRSPGAQLSAHFVIDFDGTIYQLLDTNFCCYAQEAGNYPPTAYVAIEYAGDPSTPMTNAQVLSGAAVTRWAALAHAFPIVGVVSHGTPGVAAHCNPNGSADPNWGNHSCPGTIRLAQLPGLIWLAAQGSPTPTPTPTPVPSPVSKWSLNMATSVPTGGQIAVRPDGGVFNYAGSRFYGSLPGLGATIKNIVGVAPTKTGNGYWLVGSDGAVYAFGDAGYHGSGTGNPGWGIGTLANPVVGITLDEAKQNGYVIVADNGSGAPTTYYCNETTSYH
jgi:hypothetical protein